MDKSQIYELIEAERNVQDQKYPDHFHTLGEYALLLNHKLTQLTEEWYYGSPSVSRRMLQIAALSVAYLEQCDVSDTNASQQDGSNY